MADTWLLTGIPRAGTSLCARLAARLPNTVALSEPMEDALFADTTDGLVASDRVAQFAARTRQLVLTSRRAPSMHRDGALTDQMVAADMAGDARAVEGRSPRAVVLAPARLAFPCLLRALDPHRLGGRANPELAWRLNVAFALAEADPRLAARFHLRARQNLAVATLRLAAEAMIEVLLGLIALAARLARPRQGARVP